MTRSASDKRGLPDTGAKLRSIEGQGTDGFTELPMDHKVAELCDEALGVIHAALQDPADRLTAAKAWLQYMARTDAASIKSGLDQRQLQGAGKATMRRRLRELLDRVESMPDDGPEAA